MPDAARGWYVVLAKPRQERLALQQLVNQDYEAWLPLHTTWRKVRGEWQPKSEPMFPRYLFTRCTRPQQGIGPVRSTLGVAALVRFGDRPAQLAQEIVLQLRELEARLARHPDQDKGPFAIGDLVRISEGPLRGLEGVVARVAKHRIVAMLSLLGAEREVSFTPNQLDLAG